MRVTEKELRLASLLSVLKKKFSCFPANFFPLWTKNCSEVNSLSFVRPTPNSSNFCPVSWLALERSMRIELRNRSIGNASVNSSIVSSVTISAWSSVFDLTMSYSKEAANLNECMALWNYFVVTPMLFSKVTVNALQREVSTPKKDSSSEDFKKKNSMSSLI